MLALARSFASRAARAAADSADSVARAFARLAACGCSGAAAALVFWGCCFFLVDVREDDDGGGGGGSGVTFSSALNLMSAHMNRNPPVSYWSSSTSKRTVAVPSSLTETTTPV